jgi:DNA-binding response OmpR family regulator
MTRKESKESIGLEYVLNLLVDFYELPAGIKKIPKATCKIISINSLHFNITAKEVQTDGKIIPLTRNEFDILYTIARKKGEPIPEDKIFDDIWGDEKNYFPGVLSKPISNLRAKIHPIELKIKYSQGYYLYG